MFFKKNLSFESKPEAIKLLAVPLFLPECFQLLKASGAEYFALFGGAVRDADYAAKYKVPCKIKDFDIRVWLPSSEYDLHIKSFVNKLSEITQSQVREVASPGTNKIRHCVLFKEIELDISIRAIPCEYENKKIPVEAVAIDRAGDSDIGLCSVAIDASGKAWARPEYWLDQVFKTLTVYPNSNDERKMTYAKRMKEKFPEHVVVWAGVPPFEKGRLGGICKP